MTSAPLGTTLLTTHATPGQPGLALHLACTRQGETASVVTAPIARGALLLTFALTAGCSASSSVASKDGGRSDASADATGADTSRADAGRKDASRTDARRTDALRTDAPRVVDGGIDARADVGPSDARLADATRHDAASSDAHDAADGASVARANGTLGAWQSLAPMPLPRANHCAVAAAGYLVVIGGNYMPDGGSSFEDIDAIHVAELQADGSIGAWSQAGTTPSPVSGCTAAASGNTIYLVDGIYDDSSDNGQVFSADLSTTGTLGKWAALGPLPNGQDAFYSEAWVATDAVATLYAMDSAMTLTAALHVPTAPTFGTWVEDDWLAGFLGRPEYAFTGEYVYAIGGYLSDDAGDNPAVTTVTGAPLEADGSVGSPFATQALPAPVTFGRAVAVDGWMFVIGGKTSVFGSGEATTLSSLVGSGGHLGPWTAQASLPQGRTDMALTLAGDFLYLTGGGYDGPGVATVFAAQARF